MMSGSFFVEQNGFSHKCPAIVVVDRHPLTRSCLARILRIEFKEFAILEFDTVYQLDLAAAGQIGLVALCIDSCAMTDDCVLHSLVTLRRSPSEAPVMLLTRLPETAITDTVISEVTRFGVRGYLTDRASVDIALAALRLVLAGGVYFPRSVLPDCTNWGPAPSDDIVVMPTVAVTAGVPAVAGKPAVAFTERERQVLATLQRGLSNKIIASELNLSENTVKVHLSRIMRKLKTTNRTEAALVAQRNLLNGNGQSRDGMDS
jgi:DNA-binding NarL/FixJ family response regulator